MKRLAILALFAVEAAAQFSPAPPALIVPVVGSTRGQANADFKTELQLANASETQVSGWLVLRPQGLTRRFELAPHTTLSFADVVADLGGSGLGSIDVLVDHGGIPTIVTRAYDDQPGGTTGVTVPAVRAASVLANGDSAALIVPRDLTRYRFNVGYRTLESGAMLEIVVRGSDGVERSRRTVTLGGNAFEQQTGAAFAGATLQADDLLEIHYLAGSAILYATTVDNRTNDSSIQVATK